MRQTRKSRSTPSRDTGSTPVASGSQEKHRSLSVEWWPTERPIPYARNPRIAPEAAIAKVAASLAEYGWRQPIVVDAGGRHRRRPHPPAGRQAPRPCPGAGARRHRPHPAADQGLPPGRQPHRRGELLGSRAAAPGDLRARRSGLRPGCAWLRRRRARQARLSRRPRASPIPTRCPSSPRSRSPSRATSSSWATIACSVAMPPTAAQVKRLMAGQRAGLMATDPPYLVDYDGGNHPQTWGNGGKQAGRDVATKHWDSLHRPRQRGRLLPELPRRGAGRGAQRAPAPLPVVRHDAHRGRAGGLAGQRPAGPSGDHLAQEPQRAWS